VVFPGSPLQIVVVNTTAFVTVRATMASFHETATAGGGEPRGLAGASCFPAVENPSVATQEGSPAGGAWELTGALAPDPNAAIDTKIVVHGVQALHDGRGGDNSHPVKTQEGGESPNSALTTCGDGDGSDADPTSGGASVEVATTEDRIGLEVDASALDAAAAATRFATNTEETLDANAAGSTPGGRDDDATEDARARAACADCFTCVDDEGRMSELRSMGQKELQETFRVAFRRSTASNNNQWLRRRIAGALGLESAPPVMNRDTSGSTANFQQGYGGTPGGSRLTTPNGTSIGGTTTEDGVRKSNRAARPKILDFLPSAVCAQVANELPGEAAVDRRVRVLWPAEGAFFSGVVQAFNPKNGKHKVRYDDGDVEEVLLAAERIEWVYPGEDPTVARAPATAAGGGALPTKHKAVVVVSKKINYNVPLPGKPAEVLSELPATWPSEGQHVWGRVKGHGWWPGVVIPQAAAEALGVVVPAAHKDDAAIRAVRFFDTTAASVHRHDLLPFREYEQTLGKAKKSAGFVAALTLAKVSFDKAAKRGEEVLSIVNPTKQQQAAAAKAAMVAKEAPAPAEGKAVEGTQTHNGPSSFPDVSKPEKKRKTVDVNKQNAKMLFDPAGVPFAFHVKTETNSMSKSQSQPGPKKARFNENLAVNDAELGELERRVGFTRDDDEGDFVRAGEARIAGIAAMMASAPTSLHKTFTAPKAPKRSHKKGQGLKARASAEAAGLPWPPPRPAGVGRGRGRGAGSGSGGGGLTTSGGSSGSGKHSQHRESQHRFGNPDGNGHGNPGGYNAHPGSGAAYAGHNPVGSDSGDQLGLLGRKLDALQTRVVPLAIAASQHLRRQLQISHLAVQRGGSPNTHPSAMMTENERSTLLQEMDVLQRLLNWNDNGTGNTQHGQHGYDQRRGASQSSDAHFQPGRGTGPHRQTPQTQQTYFHGETNGYPGQRDNGDQDTGAGMAAQRGSDTDLARLDQRWERGGLDHIEMAMLHAAEARDARADADGAMATDDEMDTLWGGGDDEDTKEDVDNDALEAADFLRSAGPSINVDTMVSDAHAQQRQGTHQPGMSAISEKQATKHHNTARTGSPAPRRGRDVSVSPAPSDTTQ